MGVGRGWARGRLYYPRGTDERFLKQQALAISVEVPWKEKVCVSILNAILGSVFWGQKCECSDALHAQMSWRGLILEMTPLI